MSMKLTVSTTRRYGLWHYCILSPFVSFQYLVPELYWQRIICAKLLGRSVQDLIQSQIGGQNKLQTKHNTSIQHRKL